MTAFDRPSRLKPLVAYESGPGTYRTAPHPDEIAAAIESDRAAFAARQHRRQAERAGVWRQFANQDKVTPNAVEQWIESAREKRRLLSTCLGLRKQAAPAYHSLIEIPTAVGANSGVRLVLQDGLSIRLLSPSDGKGTDISIAPPGETLEHVDRPDPTAWRVELPALVYADERLGKALLLNRRTIPTLACEQLSQVVAFLLGLPGKHHAAPRLAGDGLSGWIALLYAGLDVRIGGVTADLGDLLQDEWPCIAAIPRFSLDFDIESIVHLIAPRPCTIRAASYTSEWPDSDRVDSSDDASRLGALNPPISVPYLTAAHRLMGVENACVLRGPADGASTHSERQDDSDPERLGTLHGRTDIRACDEPSLFQRRAAVKPQHIDGLRSRNDWLLWRQSLYEKLLERIGGVPERAPLDVRTKELEPVGETRVEEVTFASAAHVRHRGLLLTPKWKAGPFPVVLCLPGSSQRPEDIVPSWGGMVSDAGYAAWIVDVKPARLRPNISREITEGASMVWNMALDLRAAVDVSAARDDLDSERIAAMGVSIGGTQTWMLAALDERVRVVVPVVGVTAYDALCLESLPAGKSYLNSHSWYYYYPILDLAEQYDLIGLIAPRPLLILGMSEDNCFPVRGLEEVNRKVASLYRLLGKEDHFKSVTEEGPHSFPAPLRRAALEWLGTFL